MAWTTVLEADNLPAGSKKAVKAGDTEILLVRDREGRLHAVEAHCPHAGAPLEKGALCDGRLICPWHTGTFQLADGALIEPPPLRSLRTYPVKEEDGSLLVDPEPLTRPTLASRGTNAPAPSIGAGRHIVSIGAGAAASALVCVLRQGGFTGTLTLLDSVSDEPVDRTMLSKFSLAGEKPIDKLPLFSPEEVAHLRIDRRRARVTLLDSDSLQTDDGETLRFDAALVAPGGAPSHLGIPGEELPHVVNIRHTPDLETIDSALGSDPKGKQAVLIGDSFIAFEAASALTQRGLRVTLVCRSPQPFSKKFGEAPAQAIVTLHQSKGVAMKLGAEARAISAAAVELKSGESLPADLVIVAIGVKPALGFRHDLTSAKDGGIAVDPSLRAAEKLWVAGDCASVDGTRIEHWRLAQQHGRVAAQGMLQAMGAPAEPAGIVPFFWTTHFGKRFGYVGHAESWEELQLDGSLGDQTFLAYYMKRDKVVAVFGCGRDSAIAMLAEAMRRTLTLAEARAAAARA